MAAVTYVDENRQFRTFRLSLIEKFGCCKELASRLHYARIMTERLLAPKVPCVKPPKELSSGTGGISSKDGAMQTLR